MLVLGQPEPYLRHLYQDGARPLVVHRANHFKAFLREPAIFF